MKPGDSQMERQLQKELRELRRFDRLSDQDKEDLHAWIDEQITSQSPARPASHTSRSRSRYRTPSTLAGTLSAAAAACVLVAGGVWYTSSDLLVLHKSVSSHREVAPNAQLAPKAVQNGPGNIKNGPAVAQNGQMIAQSTNGSGSATFRVQSSTAQSSNLLNMDGLTMNPDGTMWLSTPGAVYRMPNASQASASRWIPVKLPSAGKVESRILTALNGQDVWMAVGKLGTAKGYTVIYRSTDAGQTWSKVTFRKNLGHSTAGQVPSAMSFINQDVGWMVTQVPDFGMGGTSPGGLYRTTDGGASWKLVSTQVSPNMVSFAWIDFVTPEVGFTVAAKQNPQADAGATDGNPNRLYVTRDGGRTWSLASMKMPAGKFISIQRPTFFSAQSGVVEVDVRSSSGSTEAYLYSTSDGGASWARQGKRHLGASATPATFTTVKTGYVIDGTSIYRTTDGGVSWKQAGTVPKAAVGDAISLHFSTNREGWLYAASQAYANSTGNTGPTVLYQTSDGGQTWRKVFTS